MPIELPLGPGGADRGKTAVPGDPCYFCEVIAGRAEKAIVEETEVTLTLVNWMQFELGQVYVIPRRHAPTLFDLTDEEAVALFHTVRQDRRRASAGVRPGRAEPDPEQRRGGRSERPALPHARRAAPQGRQRLGKRPASHRGAGGQDPDEARPRRVGQPGTGIRDRPPHPAVSSNARMKSWGAVGVSIGQSGLMNDGPLPLTPRRVDDHRARFVKPCARPSIRADEASALLGVNGLWEHRL